MYTAGTSHIGQRIFLYRNALYLYYFTFEMHILYFNDIVFVKMAWSHLGLTRLLRPLKLQRPRETDVSPRLHHVSRAYWASPKLYKFRRTWGGGFWEIHRDSYASWVTLISPLMAYRFVDFGEHRMKFSGKFGANEYCLRRGVKWYRKLAVELFADTSIANAYI